MVLLFSENSENNITRPVKMAHLTVWLVPQRMLAAAISDHILVRMQSSGPWLGNEEEILLTAWLIGSGIHLGWLKLWEDAMNHQYTVMQQHSSHKTQCIFSCVHFCACGVCVVRDVIILQSPKQCTLCQRSSSDSMRPPAAYCLNPVCPGGFYWDKKIKMNKKGFF